MQRVPFRLALAATTFLTLTGSAFALDGDAFLAQINKNYEASGVTVTAEEVSVDGSDISMTGVTYKVPGAEAKPIKIGDVDFTGVEEDENQNYTVEEITFPDINMTEDKATVTASDLSLKGVFIPAKPEEKTLDSLAPFENAHSGAITVTQDGKTVFSLESMDANASVREDESGIDYDWAANGLKMDLSTAPDPKTKEAVEKLGLQTVEGTVSLKSSWEADKGTTKLDAFTLDFKDVGKLDIALAVSGLTLDLVKQIETVSHQLNDPATKDGAGLQMMGLMQQLTFDNARIRFDDASITKRALSYAGEQQGVSGEQLAQSLKAMVPLMVGQLNIPELQNAVTTAATAFLDDPKSFTISAAPAAPVAFPVIMGAAMGAPNTLPTVLGVKVTAND
jgi:hypothetical protein